MTFRDWLSVLYVYLFKVDPKSRDLPRPPRRKPPEGLLPRIPGPPAPKTAEEAILEQVFYPMGRYGIASAYFNAFCLPVSEPPLLTVGGDRNSEWYRWYAANNKNWGIPEILEAHKKALKEQEATIEEYLMGEDHGLDH